MDTDDITYVISLLICIGIGNYMKQIKDETQRKFLGTGFGFLIVFLVSGWHILHCLISARMGAAAVVLVHPSKCHLVAFVVMFGYLMFFRLVYMLGLPQPPSHTNMIQMVLTLKMAGIAFEKNASWKKLKQREKEVKDKKPSVEGGQHVEITDYDVEIQCINTLEVFHYTFNYIGILTGPYYRYRTYRDYFDTPFKNHAATAQATIKRLKSAGIYCALYLAANYLYPLSYALSDEFYNKRSFFYRLMYVWPTFFIFRMRMYTGLTLSECVCTMAGFGAYPEESDVANGEGPRKQYQHLKRDAKNRSYNFTTIVNTRVINVEKCWTFREAMKHWNICVQYWLAINVYKLFPNKKYRTAVTLLCSAYWHGFRPGHYFCIMGAPFYVPVEDMWNNLVRKNATGLKRHIINIIFWISKFFALSYLGTAFLLASFTNIWKFYSSVYHIGYIGWAIMLGLGIYLTTKKKAAEKLENQAVEKQTDEAPINEHKEKVQ